MKKLLILSFFLSIFGTIHICNAQTMQANYSATLCDKEPGIISKADLQEMADKKCGNVNLSGGEKKCKMVNFSFSIATSDNNRTLYYEKIKGDKLSKKALSALKTTEAGNKIKLGAFGIKCGREADIVKQEFIYDVVE